MTDPIATVLERVEKHPMNCCRCDMDTLSCACEQMNPGRYIAISPGDRDTLCRALRLVLEGRLEDHYEHCSTWEDDSFAALPTRPCNCGYDKLQRLIEGTE